MEPWPENEVVLKIQMYHIITSISARLSLTMCIFNYYFLDDEEDNSPTPSSDIDDISVYSAEVVVIKAFDALSIHFLTIKKHFYPLGKVLQVKCRSIGKYQLVIPLAKALITKGHVAIEGDINLYESCKTSSEGIDRY